MLAPDATLFALNRLMPPFIKSTSSNAISTRVSIDRLILGSIPDIGFAGDPGLHGPKRYNWHQMVGSIKYTLLRLQERVVGGGPAYRSCWLYPARQSPAKRLPYRHPRRPPAPPNRCQRRRHDDRHRRRHHRQRCPGGPPPARLAVGRRPALHLCRGAAYLLLGALRVNPVAKTYRVTVELPDPPGCCRIKT